MVGTTTLQWNRFIFLGFRKRYCINMLFFTGVFTAMNVAALMALFYIAPIQNAASELTNVNLNAEAP